MQTAIKQQLQAALAQRRAQQRCRQLTTMTALNATEILFQGQRYLSFSANDYLGLSHHPQVLDALRNAELAGSKASPLVTGYSAAHADLAAQLSHDLQRDRVLLFSSAFAANTGALATLGGYYDALWLDRLSHASLISGARQSGTATRRFPHQNFKQLQDRHLKSSSAQLVVVESVYSMDGDELDHAGFRQVIAAPQVDGYIDDAHGFGVTGEAGLGCCAAYSQTTLPLVSLAFGKATGVAGGALAVSEDVADYLINFCPEFIYSTAMPASQARAIQAAINVMQSAEGEQLRSRLRESIAQFQEGCAALQLPVSPSDHAIQTLLVGSDEAAVKYSERLRAAGIWCSAIRPPTVPEGSARLRITLTAAHSHVQINELIQALAVVQEQA